MDQATMVGTDVEMSGRVLDALSRAKIPVTFYDWHKVPQLDEWQLIVATPWYDSKGPLETYSRVIEAFQKAGIYEDVQMRRVILTSPEDSIVKTLVEESKERSEGFLHLLKHRNNQYSVIFAPITGPGGAVPARHFARREGLRDFLAKQLRIQPASIQVAFAELEERGSTSIYPFRRVTRELRRLGLA